MLLILCDYLPSLSDDEWWQALVTLPDQSRCSVIALLDSRTFAGVAVCSAAQIRCAIYTFVFIDAVRRLQHLSRS
jgi:hypothetical protein